MATTHDTGTPLCDRLAAHDSAIAIVDVDGAHTYASIDRRARALAARLLEIHGPLDETPVAILAEPGADVVVALAGVWFAGGIAVPLHPPHPIAEMLHVVSDADAPMILATDSQRNRALDLAGEHAMRIVDLVAASTAGADPLGASGATPAGGALMMHTSGTTGRPKGAVHTHASLAAQVDGMLEAWAWRQSDRIVGTLPLNHLHGLVNITLTSLAAGAICELHAAFDATAVWERLASGEVTVFMAVPTIYARLMDAWGRAAAPTRERWSAGARGLRLMVSGSAALPVRTLDRWREITGHTLLERYGMTELGMVLGNTLTHRVPGHVGVPFPGVEVRIAADHDLADGAADDVADAAAVGGGHPAADTGIGGASSDGSSGELLVRSTSMFREYWRRPEATAAAFDDGWFRTGDVVTRDADGFRILGRASVDIIKTGGEKVSALEIEEVYRTHPDVAEVAVVGVDDDTWGQQVCAAIVVRSDAECSADELRAWGKAQLAAAKVPRRFVFVDALARNALGKVLKPQIARLFSADAA